MAATVSSVGPAARRAEPFDGSGLVIVAEQTSELGGAERVIAAIVDRYPRASVLAPEFTQTPIPAGARLPYAHRTKTVWEGGVRRHHLLPLYARRMRQVRAEGAAVVLSVASHGWAMAVGVPAGARHLAYYFGPSPSLYTRSNGYLRAYPAPARPLIRAALPALRSFERGLLRLPHRVIANSGWASAEIARVHGRRPEVIHPPVRTDFFTPAEREREHLLLVGRLVHHKRIEAAVEAFRSLGAELVVAGHGPLLDRLRAGAPPNVRFTGYVEDAELRELYRRSRALICPSPEEFGIVMAEAQACGTPVIAPRKGGALEIVREGETGLLLELADPRSIAAAVGELDRRAFDPAACRASAERFSQERFAARIGRVLDGELRRVAS